MRVLKPSGSLMINLGDKYSASGGSHKGHGRDLDGHSRDDPRGGSQALGRRDPQRWGIPAKSLIGLPWRYALGCIDQLGLILRAEIVWHKPNGLPESVTDRVRRSHESWFHLTKQPRYYSATDEIREPHAPAGIARRAYMFNVNDAQRASGNPVLNGAGERPANPLGKLPSSVWTIPTEPLKVPDHLGIDHFAAFPLAWPLRLIAGWSPPGICTGCGEGRRPVVERNMNGRNNNPDGRVRSAITGGAGEWAARMAIPDQITGYACACPQPTAPTRPAVVLDPFAGTGTTMLAAKALGRTGIGVDRSADYCRLAAWRTTDRGELAKAMRVEKPAVQVAGQTSLFDAEVV
jgi:DNA modification methylase